MTTPFPEPFAAIIFDNDQTLIDSLPDIETAWTQWAIHYGITHEQFVMAHGATARDLVNQMIDEPRRAEALAMIERLETEINDHISARPGALAAFDAIPAERRAVVTSAIFSVMSTRLQAAGLDQSCVLVTADDVSRGKPDPEPFLLAAERLGVDPTRCLVCEDSPLGILGARDAGMATIGVPTTNPPDKLGSDVVVEDLSQVQFVNESEGIRVEVANAIQVSPRPIKR